MMFAPAVFLILWSYSAAQFPYLGKCPSPPVQQNFDMKKFEGVWYEIQRTVSFLQIASQCTYSNFSDSGYKDGSYELINEGRSPVIKLRKSFRLIVTIPDKKEPAKMELRLSDLSLDRNFWIMSTDYDNYAIAWSCSNIWLAFKYARTENLWVYSRHRELSEEVQKKVDDILNNMKHIRVKHLLKKVSQKDCDDEENTPPPVEENEVERLED